MGVNKPEDELARENHPYQHFCGQRSSLLRLGKTSAAKNILGFADNFDEGLDGVPSPGTGGLLCGRRCCWHPQMPVRANQSMLEPITGLRRRHIIHNPSTVVRHSRIILPWKLLETSLCVPVEGKVDIIVVQVDALLSFQHFKL